jgi:hydroxymethylbilane synthase
MTQLTIATRGSLLALWQANHVKAALEAARPGLHVELLVLKTQGDKIQDVPLAQVGGKGLFVKEIEEALLDGRAQLAVHSMKDVPTELAPGLIMAAVSQREDARDALVGQKPGQTLVGLARGARVGTSSLRRSCQLRAARPDLVIATLRGNVDTRLRKLDEGQHDAIVLAVAGLVRLGHGARIGERLPPAISLPAIGQGVLGLETRSDDAATIELVRSALHDVDSADAVAAERAFLGRLQGGCQTPIAGHATVAGRELELEGLVGSPDGSIMLRERIRGPRVDPAKLGTTLADRLLGRGAAELLATARAAAPAG